MSRFASARDWSLGLAGAGVCLCAFGLAMNLPIRIVSGRRSEMPPLANGSPLQVSWSGNQPDAAVTQAAQLMDPTPLFMPTSLSVASKRLGSTGLGDKFPVLTPPEALKFQAGNLRIERLPPPVDVPAGPAEALAANPPGNLALGFGRGEQAEAALPARQGWVEVTVPGTDRIVLRAAIPAGSLADLTGSNWAPVYFSATINASGLVGSVISMPSPPPEGGFSPLDSDVVEELANYLELKLALGQRLPPGFYRISIGP